MSELLQGFRVQTTHFGFSLQDDPAADDWERSGFGGGGLIVPIVFGGGETNEEAKEEDKLFRGYGESRKETRGQSDRHVEAGNKSNRFPVWSRKARSKA